MTRDKNKGNLTQAGDKSKVRFSLIDNETSEEIKGRIVICNDEDVPLLSLPVKGTVTTELPQWVNNYFVEVNGYDILDKQFELTETPSGQELRHHKILLNPKVKQKKSTTGAQQPGNKPINAKFQQKPEPEEPPEKRFVTVAGPKEAKPVSPKESKFVTVKEMEHKTQGEDHSTNNTSTNVVSNKSSMVKWENIFVERPDNDFSMNLDYDLFICVNELVRYSLGTKVFDMLVSYTSTWEYNFE